MLKRFSIGCFIFVLCLSCPAFAKDGSYTSAASFVEYSLMSLKESAASVALDNEQLKAMIRDLKEGMESLRAQLSDMENKKARLGSMLNKIEGHVGGSTKELTLTEKGLTRIKSNMESLAEDQASLQGQLNIKQQENTDLSRQQETLRSQILRLKENIKEYSAVKETGISFEFDKLKGSFADSQRILKERESQLQKIKGSYLQPLKMIEKCKNDQDILKQQLAIEQDQLTISLQQQEKLQNEIQDLEKTHQDRLSQLDADIQGLKEKNSDFSKMITEAKARFSASKVQLVNFGQSDVLRGSLSTLQDENRSLKTELGVLEQSLEKIENQASSL